MAYNDKTKENLASNCRTKFKIRLSMNSKGAALQQLLVIEYFFDYCGLGVFGVYQDSGF